MSTYYDTYGYGSYGSPYMPGMTGAQSPAGWTPGYPDAAAPLMAGMTGAAPLAADMTGAAPLAADMSGVVPLAADMSGAVPFMPASGLPAVPSGAGITPTGGSIVTVPQEESYVENILRLNRGKMATVYMTFENNSQWNAKVFRGILEAAGRDHLILSDPSTGIRYLLLMVNLDYITFDGPINYEYPFQGGVVTQQTPFPLGARESDCEDDKDYTETNTQA
jgi:spore germination protein Q